MCDNGLEKSLSLVAERERNVHREGNILEVGIEHGVVEKKGAWLQFAGELIGQGKDTAANVLTEKPDLAAKIVEAIHAKRATAPAPA